MIFRKRSLLNRACVLLSILLSVVLINGALEQNAFADSVSDQADRMLEKMSTKEKIAQMMIVAMPASDAAKVQKKYQFGGYILYGRDFYRTSKSGLKKDLASIQKKSNIPMIIGADEEGGTVVRASLYRKYRKTKFSSPQQVYNAGGYSGIRKDTHTKDKFLKSLGLNCNFAPVADVPYSRSDFIYDRAFSTSVARTVKFIRISVTRMKKDKVISVLKHFPGYGGNGDTHGRIISDNRKLKTFKNRDLKTFKAGIDAGADMVMMSHVKVNAFDSRRPASLSKKVHNYLRKEMGFDGVIITDGLGMSGVLDFVGGDEGKASVRAVKAGNDMLCVTGSYKRCYNALRKAVKDGEISKKQINSSVKRILVMKIRRGIIPRDRRKIVEDSNIIRDNDAGADHSS